jgi:hypothetical protein
MWKHYPHKNLEGKNHKWAPQTDSCHNGSVTYTKIWAVVNVMNQNCKCSIYVPFSGHVHRIAKSDY